VPSRIGRATHDEPFRLTGVVVHLQMCKEGGGGNSGAAAPRVSYLSTPAFHLPPAGNIASGKRSVGRRDNFLPDA